MIRLFENSKQAENYATYRPYYPDGVAEAIVDYAKKRQGRCGKFDLMLDVGCGTGQSTKFFHSYAEKIIGIDPSIKQIEQAAKVNYSDNITYKTGEAEALPVEENTVDLLCCGSAAHWFNFEDYFKECGRVLKPNGTLALYGYRGPNLSKNKGEYDTKAMQCLDKMFRKCIWHERLRYPRDKYREIFDMMPSQDKSRIDDFTIDKECSLRDFLLYVSTMSGYVTYQNQRKISDGPDILEVFAQDLKSLWNLDSKADNKDVTVHVQWEVYILLSEPPNLKQ